jgi:hypothetical protein
MRPQSLKAAVERILIGEEERIPIAEFLDHFYLHHERSTEQQAMIDAPPPLTGKQPFDAYVGAVGEHLARRWGLTIPEWVENKCRFLDRPFWVDDLQLLKPILLRDSPIAFRRRLIFTEAEPLRRGRFPIQGEKEGEGRDTDRTGEAVEERKESHPGEY